MAFPTYEDLILPILQILQDENKYSFSELVDSLAKKFELSDEEKEKMLPSGQQTRLQNRTGWSRTHLKKAGLVEYVSRGIYKITPKGLAVLQENPQAIDNEFLRRFPDFAEWFFGQPGKSSEKLSKTSAESEKTPEESLETAFEIIRQNLADEIIEKVKSCSPNFFEYLVVDLLVKMGYGGTREDAGERLGKSGDGGIDGIIKEDRLGLDIIYLQAKRWESVVGRPEIQKFAGALQGQRARKGVFITTSDFTREAREYVLQIDSKIILIDGEELAELMIDYNIGVSNATIYEIKKIDSDYFIED